MAGLFYVPGIPSGITSILTNALCMPAAARARSAQGASQFAAGHAAVRLPASQHGTDTACATRKSLSNRELGIFRVDVFTTLKMPKAVIISDLRAAPHVSS